MKGWVYVISNKAMPNLIKVGYSMKDPGLRAAELNHTGSPHPYVVDYEVLVENPREVEQTVHGRLRNLREGKEWFRCSAEEAIAGIKAVVGPSAQVENYKRADRERAEAIHRQKTAEEQKIRAVEEARRKREVVLDEKRRGIISRYEPALNAALPDINFWGYFAGTFVVFILGLSFLFPKMKDGSLFILTIIGSFIITPFVKNYFLEKAKESSKYKSILVKRDTELTALENGHSENRMPNEGIAIETVVEPRTSMAKYLSPTQPQSAETQNKKWSFDSQTKILRNNQTGMTYPQSRYEHQRSLNTSGYQILHGADVWVNDRDVNFL